MGTYNGPQEDLKFTCTDCGTETIQIDVDNPEDANKLLSWLATHSAQGGRYENVPVTKEEMLKRISRKAAELQQLIDQPKTSEKTEELERQVNQKFSQMRRLTDVLGSLK